MSDFIIEGNGSGAGTFTLQSPNIAGNLTLTAPAADGTNGQALVTNGSGVLSFATVGSGDVVGPASATDNAVARFDGTTGKLVQNSAVTVADTTGDITGGKYNGLTVTTTTGTLTITNGKTLAASNTLTLAGTDSTTMTFPTTNASIARTDAGQTFTGTQVMTSPRVITSINDTNGNELIGVTATGSAVNEITVANAATGNNPVISATGGDTNIGITLTPKGTGAIKLSGLSYPTADGTANQVIQTNGSGVLSFATVSGSGSPGGSDTYVQFNDSGSFGGDAGLTYNKTTDTLSVNGISVGRGAASVSTNTAVGYQALNTNTTGTESVAFGYQALNANTTGSNNTAVGYTALATNNTGGTNTAVGYQALNLNTTGSGNVSVGRNAGKRITTGSQNICIGDSPGDYVNYLTTGSNNILIGFGTASSGTGSTNEIVISTPLGGQGKGNNTAYINPNGGGAYNGGNTTTWTTTSDRRLKKNIVDNTEGLEKINDIRVRNFEYRLPEEVEPELKPSDAVKKEGIQLGVIAQELQEVCPDCVTEQSTGILSVNTDGVFWHMVNAIKQLKTELDSVKAELATLKGA